VKVNSRSPASSRLSATARHLSRHLRMNDLRRVSVTGAKVWDPPIRRAGFSP
jgi:hypothetical protein